MGMLWDGHDTKSCPLENISVCLVTSNSKTRCSATGFSFYDNILTTLLVPFIIPYKLSHANNMYGLAGYTLNHKTDRLNQEACRFCNNYASHSLYCQQ